MSINEIIIWAITIIMVLGAIDRSLGNRTGLGQQFEEGILAMGALALSMAGIIVLAPKLSDWLSPVVVPLYKMLGADPAMFAGTLLANDMGGFFLAQQMTTDPQIVLFSGGILGAMLGATIVFSIPVGLGIINKEDTKYLAQGMLCGIVTIPIGALVAGIVMGMPVVKVFMNLIPIIIVAVLIAVGLLKIPEGMIKGFNVFGKIIVAVAAIGLAIGGLDLLLGIKIFDNQDTLAVGFQTVGGIAITLAGAYGLVFLITKIFKNPLMKLGHLLGMNDVAAAGLIASLANNIAMFQTVKGMDKRGKVINMAFAVSASFTFGDHLGFTAGVAPQLITPMIVGKLAGGISAIILAIFLSKSVFKVEES